MTKHPKASVIVVNQNHPAALRGFLMSLRFQQYPNFEAIVVSDTNPVTLFPEIEGVRDVKFVPFDTTNISAARNLGLRFSAGDIVAFCDDDAIPEPTWLAALVSGFDSPEVGAAGGYVRGPNGPSFQWKSGLIDRYGNQTPLDLRSDDAVVLSGDRITGIKIDGTNMAFRATALRDLGGFDETFHYLLGETDVNYRLGVAGWKTAIVPRAQVYHRSCADIIRWGLYRPTDFTQIGVGKAYFCKRHGAAARLDRELETFRQTQRKRLVAAMVDGKIEPFDIDVLMASLERGITEGLKCQKKHANVATHSSRTGFKPYKPAKKPSDGVALSSGVFGAGQTKTRAAELAKKGVCATVFRFSISTRFHKTSFTADGYWTQTAGIFGRSDRTLPLFQRGNLDGRVKQEIKRLEKVRPMVLVTKQ